MTAPARPRRVVSALLAGLRGAGESLFVHGLLGWLYTAAWAAARPDGLPGRVSSWLPVRRDTFGICCFALSALACLALSASGGAGTGGPWTRRARRPGLADAALLTTSCYALLAWAYLSVNSLVHPNTIGQRLTHLSSAPTEGATAAACFAASAAALCALRTLRTLGDARSRAAVASPGPLAPPADAPERRTAPTARKDPAR